MNDKRHDGGGERRSELRVLTRNDVCAIADQVAALLPPHVCRYDIEPEDMKDLLAFVRVFQRGAMDIKDATRSMLIKKVIPRLVIGALLTVLADYLGFLRPVLNMAQKVMRGGG